MKLTKVILLFLALFMLKSNNIFTQELVIGEERIEPGIAVVFEGAIKDMIMPSMTNLRLVWE